MEQIIQGIIRCYPTDVRQKLMSSISSSHRLNEIKSAADIDDDIKIIADLPYGEQSLLFKGTHSVSDIQANVDSDGKLNIFQEYAVAYWHYTHGDLDRAKVLFERVCARPEIGAYVQIAAEAKLKSLLDTQ